MKLLCIVIPCYNSQEYLAHCCDTILNRLEERTDIEIIIINDGSTDNTASIANDYVSRYPEIVKVIHKENQGHGDAINTGLKNANSLYFKVVDSDDWVDQLAFDEILKVLEAHSEKDNVLDLVVSNFVYEKAFARHKKVMRYTKLLPTNTVFGWDDVKHFPKGRYMLMHSLMFRTELLRECSLYLPKHTFYVDNLFAYIPLKHVKKIFYVDVDFYRYFIGRVDQSVNEKIMINRIDQQIKVNKLMLESIEIKTVYPKRLRKYLFNYFEIVTVVSTVLLLCSGTPENIEKKHELWEFIKAKDEWTHSKLNREVFGILLNLPVFVARPITIFLYSIAHRIVGFN